MEKIGRVFGDSACDSRANFNDAVNAEPVIKPEMNSIGRPRYPMPGHRQ